MKGSTIIGIIMILLLLLITGLGLYYYIYLPTEYLINVRCLNIRDKPMKLFSKKGDTYTLIKDITFSSKNEQSIKFNLSYGEVLVIDSGTTTEDNYCIISFLGKTSDNINLINKLILSQTNWEVKPDCSNNVYNSICLKILGNLSENKWVNDDYRQNILSSGQVRWAGYYRLK
jgi:hypothetical protein